MKALVTGGTGFIGGALARRLHAVGWEVTATGRNPDEGQKLRAAGIEFLQVDLSDEVGMRLACRDQDVVFHAAAKVDSWGRYEDFYRVNVLGTQNLIDTCLRRGVNRLVHISSPSIYFRYGSRTYVSEDDPLPAQQVNHYAATKLIAEHVVLNAHLSGLPSIIIRPRAVFGPGDTTILPRLIDRLQRRRLPVIGGGQNLVDLTYIDNLVDALLLCIEAPKVATGKAYNITNGEPVLLWEKIRDLCALLDLRYPKRHISRRGAARLAGIIESFYRALRIRKEPPLTRYTVGVMSTHSTLNITRARMVLGYEPHVSIDEGLQRFATYWKQTHG